MTHNFWMISVVYCFTVKAVPPQVVIVEGHPGSGKTNSLQSFCDFLCRS